MDLKKGVIKARSKLLAIEPEYEEVKKRYDKALKEWSWSVIKLEEADYQQAQIDGRTKKYPFGQKKPKPLTLSQIYEVAKRLGIDIDKEKKDEEGT